MGYLPNNGAASVNRLVGRVILAALLIMTVAGKIHISAKSSPDATISRAVVKVLAAHGMSGHVRVSSTRDVLRFSVEVRSPGCERTIEILPVDINLQAAPLFDIVVEPGYTMSFAYLDRTWRFEDRMDMRFTWLRNKALSIIGLGRFVTIPTGLLIAEPPGCHVGPVDWSLVWDTRTLTSGQKSAQQSG
jgi:hypothetical protein